MQNSDIRTLREIRGMTQRRLASLLQVTPEYLSMIENGRKEPSERLLGRVREILNQSDNAETELKQGCLNSDCAKLRELEARVSNLEALVISLLAKK